MMTVFMLLSLASHFLMQGSNAIASEGAHPDALYFQNLAASQAQLDQRRSLARRPQKRSAIRRKYHLGETWTVMTWRMLSSFAFGDGELLRYEVNEVKESSNPEVGLQIQALSGNAIPSPLDFNPLDARNFKNWEETRATQLPELPAPVAAQIAPFGWAPILEKSYRIESSDFFGRPIEMLWQAGDPWPVYLRTPSEIMITVPERTARSLIKR